jgi:NAD(P)-dependent dehydrogenase (short-subunit alcohol dehydrogenase family)
VSERAVVVTGASTGIGEACARLLAERGFTVLAGVRKDADGERLRDHVPQRIEPLRIDVTDQAAIEAAAAKLSERPLAGLVNNAGVAVSGPLEFLPIEELRRQLEVNLIGQVAVTQALLPALRAGRGRIVNIGSVGGRVAAPLLGPYAASKFAMEGITDSLRRELHGSGVGVSIVEPGAVATPIWDKGQAAADGLLEQSPPEAERHYGHLIRAIRAEAEKAARRAVPPARVAEAVLHALTARRPRTRYVVGRDARMRIAVAGLLPDRVFDALVARALRG